MNKPNKSQAVDKLEKLEFFTNGGARFECMDYERMEQEIRDFFQAQQKAHKAEIKKIWREYKAQCPDANEHDLLGIIDGA